MSLPPEIRWEKFSTDSLKWRAKSKQTRSDNDNDLRHLCVICTSFGETRLKGTLNSLRQTPCMWAKLFFSVPMYNNSLVHLSAGHAVLFLPCCDESCYSRTNESASCNNLCSFKVSMSRSPLTLFSLSILPPNSLPPLPHSPSIFLPPSLCCLLLSCLFWMFPLF